MIIVLANTKGGVGKTTLASHLAVWLYDRGARVAALDADKQHSTSVWIGEAEPNITVRTATTPEECLAQAQILSQSHDFVIGDAPAGFDDVSRTLLILADLALVPITPSILDVRSLAQAMSILSYAHDINGGRPDGRFVLNKFRRRDTISREVLASVPRLGLPLAAPPIRDLQAYRDAAQQATVVTRMNRKGASAAAEVESLFSQLLGDRLSSDLALRGVNEPAQRVVHA